MKDVACILPGDLRALRRPLMAAGRGPKTGRRRSAPGLLRYKGLIPAQAFGNEPLGLAISPCGVGRHPLSPWGNHAEPLSRLGTPHRGCLPQACVLGARPRSVEMRLDLVGRMNTRFWPTQATRSSTTDGQTPAARAAEADDGHLRVAGRTHHAGVTMQGGLIAIFKLWFCRCPRIDNK